MKLINNSYKNELQLVNKLIKSEIINETVIQELYDYIFKKNGKQLRPLLSLIASSTDKRKNSKRVQIAAIIELLHTATLVHDDVVDESPLRRGAKTINSFWTNSHGVLMGDFIYSKAFMLMVNLSNLEILNELSKATNDISQGELIQLDLIGKKEVTLDKLLQVSYFKTGRLFEASAKTGAMLANISADEIKTFGLLGKAIGIAFQIQDDLLDYKAFKLNTGKPSLKDFREGKITFPLYFAMQNAQPKDKEFLLKHLGSEKISQIHQAKIYKLIQSEASQKATKTLLKKYINEAHKYLESLKNHACYNEMLNLITVSTTRKI